MSDQRKPTNDPREPSSRIQPSGYFRGADPEQPSAQRPASERHPAEQTPAGQPPADKPPAEKRLSADRLPEEQPSAVEQAAGKRTENAMPAQDRREAQRTLHDVDAVRDDPHAQIIPHGVPSGTTATLHETSDVGLKMLAGAGAVVLGLVVVALILVRVLTGIFYSSPESQPQGGSPIETAAPPAAVELRANPLPAWQRYHATAEAQLNGYGWVNQQAGVAHIPIERAMTLLTQGVLPVTGQESPPAPAATPTPDGS